MFRVVAAFLLCSCGAFAAEKFVPDLAPLRAAVDAGDFAAAAEHLQTLVAAARQAEARAAVLAWPLKMESERYLREKKLDRAEWLLARIVKIWEAEFGPSHRQVAFGLLDLADALRRQGKVWDAEPILLKAVEILDDHPAALKPLEDLTELYFAAGRYRDVVPLCRQLVRVREKEYGAPGAPALGKLASALHNSGNDTEARELEERIASLRSAAGSPPTGVSQAVFRVGGGVSSPVPLYKVDPVYSEEARQMRFSGTVIVYIEVDTAGEARNIHVVKWAGLDLDERAIEAVKKWRFRPGMRDGKPVVVAAHVEVSFRLL